jgi:hypothetical protein
MRRGRIASNGSSTGGRKRGGLRRRRCSLQDKTKTCLKGVACTAASIDRRDQRATAKFPVVAGCYHEVLSSCTLLVANILISRNTAEDSCMILLETHHW